MAIRPLCYYDSQLCQEAKNKDNYSWETFENPTTSPLQCFCLISQFQTLLSYKRGVTFQVDKPAADSHTHTCPLIVHFQLISGGNQGWAAISPHSKHDKHSPLPAHPLPGKLQALSFAITTVDPSIKSSPNPGNLHNNKSLMSYMHLQLLRRQLRCFSAAPVLCAFSDEGEPISLWMHAACSGFDERFQRGIMSCSQQKKSCVLINRSRNTVHKKVSENSCQADMS